MTRRMFLQGAGKTLFAIPFLPSLLPKEAWAQAACAGYPVRFFMLGSQWSPTPALFVGGLTGNNRKSDQVTVRSLAGLSNVSPIFGSDFNGLLTKMNIIRGIDSFGPSKPPGSDGGEVSGHDYAQASCGAPHGWDHSDSSSATSRGFGSDHELPPIVNMSSIDMILSQSAKLAPSHIPATRRLLSLAPTSDFTAYSDWGGRTNGSSLKQATTATHSGVVKLWSSQELYNFLVNAFSGGTMTPTPPPPTTNSDRDVIQAIYEDYKSVRDSAKISSADRFNLESFMAMISDTMNSLGSEPTPDPAPVTLSCNKPANTFPEDNTNNGRFRNIANILVAAMACDLNRVANLQLNSIQKNYSQTQLHSLHHELTGYRDPDSPVVDAVAAKAAYDANWVNAGKNFAYLLNKMNSIQEGERTLLDNSIVYWWSQHGMAQGSGHAHGDGDRGIVVAGGGGGALEVGYFIDYRHATERYSSTARFERNRMVGMPVNNLLMTFLNAFAVPASAYERPGEPGFGAYWNERHNTWLFALNKMTSSYRDKILAMRRQSLPFLFKKPVC